MYKKAKRCSNIDVIMPAGLQMGDFDEKRPSRLDWPNTKIQEIIPNQFNQEKIPPSPSRSSRRSSELSLQFLTRRKFEKSNFQQCEELHPADDIDDSDILSDVNSIVPDVVSTSPKRNKECTPYVPFEDLNNLLSNGNVSAPYVSAGHNSEENQTDDISSRSDILSDVVPDVVFTSPKRNKEATPYVTAGNSNRGDQDMTPSNNEHSTQYIPLEERNAPIPRQCINCNLAPEDETTDCRSYVPFSSYVPNAEVNEVQCSLQHPYVIVIAADVDERELTLQESQYVPFNDTQNTTEEEPLLVRSQNPHVFPQQLEASTRL